MKFGNGLSTNNTRVWAMREKGNDELSALMDGEATELEMHRVLHNIDEDPEQAAKWQRYHLVSAILKKEIRPCSAQHLAKLDLASRVSEALAEEPVLIHHTESASHHKPVVAESGQSSWWRPMANVAIAASVAAVVVIGWQQTQPAAVKPAVASVVAHANANAPAANLNANVMPVQYGNAAPVSQSFGVMPRSVAVPVEYVRPQKLDEQRFNRYLISHSGNAAFATQGGQLPYVRVVTLKPVDSIQR